MRIESVIKYRMRTGIRKGCPFYLHDRSVLFIEEMDEIKKSNPSPR